MLDERRRTCVLLLVSIVDLAADLAPAELRRVDVGIGVSNQHRCLELVPVPGLDAAIRAPELHVARCERAPHRSAGGPKCRARGERRGTGRTSRWDRRGGGVTVAEPDLDWPVRRSLGEVDVRLRDRRLDAAVTEDVVRGVVLVELDSEAAEAGRRDRRDFLVPVQPGAVAAAPVTVVRRRDGPDPQNAECDEREDDNLPHLPSLVGWIEVRTSAPIGSQKRRGTAPCG